MPTPINLNGLRILNTRPINRSETLGTAIEKAGGVNIVFPVLEIVKSSTWDEPLPDLTAIDLALFTSPNAVDFFVEKLTSQKRKWPSSLEIIAIGKATVDTLARNDLQATYLPQKADSEHVLKLPVLENIAGKKIVLVKGEGGRNLIPETLAARGARLIFLEVYQRILPKVNKELLTSLWRNDIVDIILFTSQQTVLNLFALFEPEAHTWLRSKPCVVISKRIEQIASSMGMKKMLLAQYDTIIEALGNYNGNSKP